MFKKSFLVFLAVIIAITGLFVTTTSASAEVKNTPFFSIFYGTIGINGTPAPVGTLIQFVTPRGEVAGEWIVKDPGILPLTQVYGNDFLGTPGFYDGETITVHINGLVAQVNKILTWHNDWNPQEIEVSQIVEVPILEVSSSCQNGQIIVSFDGTASNHDGPVWGTITGDGRYDMPFLYADSPKNSTATLKTQAISIKTGETIVFLRNTSYNLKLWGGTYDQGPTTLIDYQTVTTISCSNDHHLIFLPIVSTR